MPSILTSFAVGKDTHKFSYSKLAKIDFHPSNKEQRTREIIMFSRVTGEYAKNRDLAVPYEEPGTSIHGGYILIIKLTRCTNFSNLFLE